MTYWTDYPITALGDEAGKPAPVRPCKVIRVLGEKWIVCEAEGVKFETKRWYVYGRPARLSDGAPCITLAQAEYQATKNGAENG